MHTFKGGDIVRRTGGSYFEVQQGEEYVVSPHTGSLTLKLIGKPGTYTAEKFTLVKKSASPPSTDEELADEYRTLVARLREIRQIMVDRGFALHHRCNDLPCSPSPSNDATKYYFKKVITTTKEV